MGSWALVKNGIVENVIAADSRYIANITKNYDACVELTDGLRAAKGWGFTNDTFVEPSESPDPRRAIRDNLRAIREAGKSGDLSVRELSDAVKLLLELV